MVPAGGREERVPEWVEMPVAAAVLSNGYLMSAAGCIKSRHALMAGPLVYTPAVTLVSPT